MRTSTRVVLLAGVIFSSAFSTPYATPWAQAQDLPVSADTLIRHVRQALGRGAVDRARTMAASTQASDDVKAVATAIVEIFEGKTADAKARLTPAADVAGHPDALLELGTLDLREGRRADGRRRLGLLMQQGYDMTPENAFRVARAAYALGEIRQANTMFQRVGQVPLQQADMETTWGDMLFAKHQAGEAVRSYRAALDADPSWIRAHLGLARALAHEEPPAADAAVAKALSLAPLHPDVQLLVAERELAEEDRAAAVQALDKVAAARPGSYDEIALRASVAYASGDTASAESQIAAAVAKHPFFVAGYQALGAQAARAYRFEDAAAYARKAVALDAEDPSAHADLGLYLMRTGDEKTAREELERAFRLDPFDTVTFNLLQLLDTLASFAEVEHGPFVFKFAKDEADVLKPYALPLADLAYKTFSERYGFTPKGPILVEVFARHDDFAVRTLGLPGLVGALGACFGRVIAMDSPKVMRASASAPKFSWQATLWHEIAHVFSLQASNFKVPRWLTEGISVYEEHRYNPAWGRELTLEYARALAAKRTFGVKGLPNAFQRPRDLAMAYFEASLLTEHLVSLNGDAGLRALLAAYAEGAKDPEAFTKAFGKTVDEVEASFKAFVDSRYGQLAQAMNDIPGAGRGQPPSIDVLKGAVAKQPDSYFAQWSLGAALFEQGDLAGAKAALEKAAALAPMAQGDNSPHALLAAIASKDGRSDAARQHLRQLLTWDHDNVDAARQLATMAKADGDLNAENFAFRIVADVDPFDASAHAALGKRALERKEYAPALVELLASLALGPPNVAEAHADVAEAYLGLGRNDEARRAALKALEQAPTFARAQDLLLAARGGK